MNVPGVDLSVLTAQSVQAMRARSFPDVGVEAVQVDKVLPGTATKVRFGLTYSRRDPGLCRIRCG